jgi:hypothetical protein
MYYGNKINGIKRVLIVGIIFSKVISILFIIIGLKKGTIESFNSYLIWICYAFGIGMALPVIYLFTFLFGIVITNDRIQRFFLQKFIIIRNSLYSIANISGEEGYPIDIKISDGSSIRFSTAHLYELNRLSVDLSKY